MPAARLGAPFCVRWKGTFAGTVRAEKWDPGARAPGPGLWGLEATQGNDNYNLWGGAGEFLKKKLAAGVFFSKKKLTF